MIIIYVLFVLLNSESTHPIKLSPVEDNVIIITEALVRDIVIKLVKALSIEHDIAPLIHKFIKIQNLLLSPSLEDAESWPEIKEICKVETLGEMEEVVNEVANEEINNTESARLMHDDVVIELVDGFLKDMEYLNTEYRNELIVQSYLNNGKILSNSNSDEAYPDINQESYENSTETENNEFWSPNNKTFQESGRRVYAGKTTTVKRFPFVAAIILMGRFIGAGAIVTSDLVVTAASGLQLAHNNRFFRENPSNLIVRVGSSFHGLGGDQITVTEIYFHPGYDPRTLKNNICMLRLKRHIHFKKKSKRVKKIDMDKTEAELPIDTPNIMIIGWGAKKKGNKISNEGGLAYAHLDIYALRDCRDIYSKDFVTEKNFCAGFITRGGGACNQDVGNPAIVDGLLVGIVSFGAPICGSPDSPTVFTKIGYYYDWIETIMEQKVPTGKATTSTSTMLAVYFLQQKQQEALTSTIKSVINFEVDEPKPHLVNDYTNVKLTPRNGTGKLIPGRIKHEDRLIGRQGKNHKATTLHGGDKTTKKRRHRYHQKHTKTTFSYTITTIPTVTTKNTINSKKPKRHHHKSKKISNYENPTLEVTKSKKHSKIHKNIDEHDKSKTEVTMIKPPLISKYKLRDLLRPLPMKVYHFDGQDPEKIHIYTEKDSDNSGLDEKSTTPGKKIGRMYTESKGIDHTDYFDSSEHETFQKYDELVQKRNKQNDIPYHVRNKLKDTTIQAQHTIDLMKISHLDQRYTVLDLKNLNISKKSVNSSTITSVNLGNKQKQHKNYESDYYYSDYATYDSNKYDTYHKENQDVDYEYSDYTDASYQDDHGPKQNSREHQLHKSQATKNKEYYSDYGSNEKYNVDRKIDLDHKQIEKKQQQNEKVPQYRTNKTQEVYIDYDYYVMPKKTKSNYHNDYSGGENKYSNKTMKQGSNNNNNNKNMTEPIRSKNNNDKGNYKLRNASDLSKEFDGLGSAELKDILKQVLKQPEGNEKSELLKELLETHKSSRNRPEKDQDESKEPLSDLKVGNSGSSFYEMLKTAVRR